MAYKDIVQFWFNGNEQKDRTNYRMIWFGIGSAQERKEFDDQIKSRFGDVIDDLAQNAELRKSWIEADDADGALATILALDQFPRNIYRGSAKAFAYDQLALECAKDAVKNGIFERLSSPLEKLFVVLPYEHSEDVEDVRLCVALSKEHCPTGVAYAEKHLAIVERFGRYPHRNEVLNRASTEEERKYLSSGGDRFGQ